MFGIKSSVLQRSTEEFANKEEERLGLLGKLAISSLHKSDSSPACFTILKVAANCHELTIQQHIMWPSVARASAGKGERLLARITYDG